MQGDFLQVRVNEHMDMCNKENNTRYQLGPQQRVGTWSLIKSRYVVGGFSGRLWRLRTETVTSRLRTNRYVAGSSMAMAELFTMVYGAKARICMKRSFFGTIEKVKIDTPMPSGYGLR
ncbi:uncharacterized protein LOC143561205 [Bidens hawaiensis]|uniref:uncharacterized protein LOC143561205 n=1 Tax=Bidens hawaiensis TaxID=980011 RepID=UPI00404919A2